MASAPTIRSRSSVSRSCSAASRWSPATFPRAAPCVSTPSSLCATNNLPRRQNSESPARRRRAAALDSPRSPPGCNLFPASQYSPMQGHDTAVPENDPRMHSVTDEDLMLQGRDGAGETLGVLFDRYQTPLLNFSSKLPRDRGLSEDLVQEVFLRILPPRQTYRPAPPFPAGIYQIPPNPHSHHLPHTLPHFP